MQYLLWLCFGLLAVVPWQVIRGEDGATPSEFDHVVDDSVPKPKHSAVGQGKTGKTPGFKPGTRRLAQSNQKSSSAVGGDSGRNTKLLSQSTQKSLIFRSQNAPAAGLPPDPMSADNPPETGFMADDRLTGRSGQAYGTQFSASAITGPGIGRQHGLLPIQFMPYAFVDNNLFFADLRGFTDAVNGYGTNLGGGYRRYLPRFDRILGFNGFYDYDNTSGALFREMGFGVESLGALYDVRANAYLPMGSQAQQLSLSNINGTQQFVGHFLQVDQAKVIANALHGFDAEIGVPLTGRIAKRHDVRVFGGGYWFEGTQIDAFGGWKARIQGNIVPNVQANLQVSNDQQFNTNVVFGVTWTFGGYREPEEGPQSQYSRMTTPVQRQYNMVVGLTTQVLKNVTVLDPTTGNPYFFEHVESYATGPTFDGTAEHPFLTVQDAQNALGASPTVDDIIFVHANSQYTGVGVTLQDNVRVLGESANVEHTVNTAAGALLLPHPTTGTAINPIFLNSPGDGVTLANNAEFSGFQIGDSTVAGSGPLGVGIFGLGVSNVILREDTVSSTTGEGVSLTGTGGTITFAGDTINAPSSGATAFLVNGTVAGGSVVFGADPLVPAGTPNPTPGVINNTGGFALLVENTAAGSTFNISGGTVNDNAGQGVQFSNDAGFLEFGAANLTNELGMGLNLLSNSGTFVGSGAVTIAGVVDDAVNIQNLAATGQVDFLPTGAINISGRQARGINILDDSGAVAILAPVIVAAAGDVALPAIESSGNDGNVTFGNITIDNGGRGIVLDPDAANVTDTGLFTVRGTTTITGAADDAITVTNVDSVVTFNTVNITNRGRIGIELLDTNGSVTFAGLTTISNVAPNITDPFPGIDIRGNAANTTMSFANVNITGAIGPAPVGFGGVGVNIGEASNTDTIHANPGRVLFSILDITANGGTALYADNVGVATGTTPAGGLLISAGAISAAQAPAVNISNAVLQATLTSVTSTASPTSGIILTDNTPLNNTLASALSAYAFTVTGNAGGRGSGGTISNATNAGVVLNNTGGVSLSAMNINNNASGVNATDTLRLTLNNDGLATNVGNGVNGTNVQEVDILNSTFNNNGAAGGNQINLTANAILPLISPTGGSYLWNIENNSALGGFAGSIITPVTGGDAIFISSSQRLQDPVSGLTTPLVLNFNDNTVFVNAPGTSAINDAWIGPQSGNMDLNNITLTGGNNAFFINDSDLNFTTNFEILGNTVAATGGGNIGILVNDLGPTDIFIGSITQTVAGVTTTTTNNFTFTQVGGNAVNATGNVAMEFTTGQNSQIDVFSNVVTMTGGNGVADQFLVFKFLQSPTVITVSDNNVSLQNQTIGIGQGADFLAATGDINLNGLLNNTISINGVANQAGQNWVFFNPGIVTIGSFLVNGFSVP